MELELSEGLVRIRVALDAGDGGPDHDWIWAEPLGSGRFRVESCPFFAYGISRNDVIGCSEARGEDPPAFQHVYSKSGHRTLRFALDPAADLSGPEIQALLERLLELGCTHEALRPKIVAVDLPPEADVGQVAALLQRQADARRLLWEWADPILS
jgi:hypothetical protein